MRKIVLMSVFSLIFITGCDIYGGGIIVDTGYSYGYNNAPPARAHGRRTHRYHYYPNAEFYFDTGSNMYYFLDSNLRWTFSVNLPIHLRNHLHNNYVEIEMDDARPYTRHKYYKNKYRKHKSKYKNNRRYDSRSLNDGARYNSKHKYDARSLNDGSKYESSDKKKAKKWNKKYREDDKRHHSKDKKNKQNKHGLHE